MSVSVIVLNPEVKSALDAGFRATFAQEPQRYFSAPGRTEVSGNHTDHQRGRVLAGAVNLDTVAAVRLNGTNVIRILSKGYPMCEVSLEELEPVASEVNSTPALIRGVAARFTQLGCKVEGFDAYCESTVLPGSGLSSSAAYEVLIGTIINHLFFDAKVSQPEIAQIGQYAENVFFGKPCGLMDQTASAVGGLVTIDFADKEHPDIRPVNFDFASSGHALCIIDSRADHADLTDEYAAVTLELKSVCQYFGKEVTTEIPEEEFYAAIPELRKICTDRAIMRVIHEYNENRRVPAQVACLENGDFAGFLKLTKESGFSSWMYLQNVIPAGYVDQQAMAVALGLCEHYLQGKGAYRVHGGGFAGTVQAFVPFEILDSFKAGIDAALGEGACHILSIRPQGGVEAMPRDDA
ncbi:MAG: galactokinase family protein [Oscillospiraceae bacterium]